MALRRGILILVSALAFLASGTGPGSGSAVSEPRRRVSDNNLSSVTTKSGRARRVLRSAKDAAKPRRQVLRCGATRVAFESTGGMPAALRLSVAMEPTMQPQCV